MAINHCGFVLHQSKSIDQTLAFGWPSPNFEEIILVNPSHKKIANRAKLLLNKRYPAKVIGYHPNNLIKKSDYN